MTDTKPIVHTILDGIKGLLFSRKGTLCLIILTVSAVSLFLHRLDPMAFSAIVSVIGTVYCHTSSKVNCTAINAGATIATITQKVEQKL